MNDDVDLARGAARRDARLHAVEREPRRLYRVERKRSGDGRVRGPGSKPSVLHPTPPDGSATDRKILHRRPAAQVEALEIAVNRARRGEASSERVATNTRNRIDFEHGRRSAER